MTFKGITLFTPNAQRLAEFYHKVFQCNIEGDGTFYAVSDTGAMFDILQIDDISNSGNPNIDIAFDVTDVDSEYVRLSACGVSILQPPTDRFWGMRNFIFADPDGNRIVFTAPIKNL